MRAGNSSREQKSIVRQGIQALYTFTPFKLLRAAEDEEFYTLILAPVASFEVNPRPRWRSKSYKALLKVPISAKAKAYKRVVQPYKLYSFKFRKGSEDSYIYKQKGAEEERLWKYPPTYMEFSWSALNSGYYCSLGWTLLSSQSHCPQEEYCPSMKGSPCPYYSRKPLSYASLFNVYPRIQRKFEDPIGELTPMLGIRYEDRPLAMLRFTDCGSFLAFIDGVVFSPKLAWMFTQPMIFLEEGLGFKVGNVHAIELEFLPETLNDFIKNILLLDNKILKWIILKYRLYMGDSKGYIHEKRGIKAFERLYGGIARQVVQGVEQDRTTVEIIKDIQDGSITPEIIDFACVLFLHSLAHILKNALVAKYGCKTEDIDYYIEHPRLRVLSAYHEKVRIVLFETATGGFGYLRSFVEEIKNVSRADILEELIDAAAKSFKESCEEKVEKSLKNLENELKPFQDRYKNLVNLILRIYHDSFPDTGVYPHVNSIRKAIAEAIPEFSPEERSLLDDLLAKGPHCWDGCQLCVMMERGCNFLPFDQPFLVSERLLRASLDKILSMIREPVSFFPLKKGVKKEFEYLLSAARSKIDLVSPWISPEIVEDLLRLSRERYLKVRIITKIDPSNETQVQSIERLIQASKDSNLQAKVIDELHAKGMLVDDIMLLYGSFNFTISGLSANVENVAVDFSLQGAKKFKEEFDELWKRAKPLVLSEG